MKNPHRYGPEPEVLSSHVSDRLLTRAAELDVAQTGRAEVAGLRAAAVEAGIAPSAFDAALDELRGGGQVPDVQSPHWRPRIRAVVLGIAALILAGAVTVSRVVRAPAVPMIEQAFQLRCLSPGAAAELVRPMLERASIVVISGSRAPRVLTVRTTPEQMVEVRALLDRQDGVTCQAPATTR